MKKGWKTELLGELCDVLDHKRKPITKRDREAGEYPYYGATGVLDNVAGYLFDEPLVLVGDAGAKWASGENSAFAVEGKIWVNNHAHVLRPHRTVLLDNWLIYHLNHTDLIEFVSGLTVPKLNQGRLREIPIPVPPLAEQQRIVGLLDEAFEGIATAKANAEKNLQNARALFECHLQSVFTKRGTGWIKKRLEECFRLKSGDGLISKEMKGGGYSVYGGNGIAGTHDEFNLSGDNVIIGRVGALCGNARHITEEIWLTDNAFKVVDQCFEFDGAFLTYLLNFKDLRSFARQAAQPVISNSSLKDVTLTFPQIREQKRIAATLDDLHKETQRLATLYERKQAALEALKKSLLHQAFSGEL